ncbi:MAG: NADH:flavin oxidoreductase [Actinobacteria bacterium]|nr:NADH:flavin oxidoreductase [Actinomycetota bacterium]
MTTPDAFAPAELGPVTLRNRIIKAATFEGRTPDHVVTDSLIDFHREVAAGGVGMTTVAYLAVSRAGCGTPNEIALSPKAVDGLTRLTDAIHGEGAKASAQIGHAGAVAAATGLQGRSPSRIFSPLAMRFTKPLDDHEITEVIDDFATSAQIVADSGFDAVELHFGHGYLPSEFLSPKLNRRRDRWGGSLENRARLARGIAEAVRTRLDGQVAVLAKLNMDDGVPGGFWVDEAVAVARLLDADGTLDALELTGGSSLQNPMYLFHGDAPIRELAATFPPALRPGFRLAAGRFMKTYPYSEGYFRPLALQFVDAVTMPVILLGGINNRATIERAMLDGFGFVAMARALLREPDLVNRMIADGTDEGRCIHCNKCMATIYSGTRCVLIDDDRK